MGKGFFRLALSIGGGLALWEFAVDWFRPSEFFVVAPSKVALAAVKLSSQGVLLNHFLTSAYELLLAFVLAIVLGVFIGYWMAVHRKVELLLDPWLAVFNAVPTILLVPLMIAWFGLGMLPKVLIVFLSAVFPIILNTYGGVCSVDQDLVELARSYLATRRQIFSEIIFHSALPEIVAGCKLGLGRGLVGVVTAEMFGALAGLGHMLIAGAESYATAEVFLSVVILGLLGSLNVIALTRLEEKLAPWRQGRAGGI